MPKWAQAADTDTSQACEHCQWTLVDESYFVPDMTKPPDLHPRQVCLLVVQGDEYETSALFSLNCGLARPAAVNVCLRQRCDVDIVKSSSFVKSSSMAVAPAGVFRCGPLDGSHLQYIFLGSQPTTATLAATKHTKAAT